MEMGYFCLKSGRLGPRDGMNDLSLYQFILKYLLVRYYIVIHSTKEGIHSTKIVLLLFKFNFSDQKWSSVALLCGYTALSVTVHLYRQVPAS